MLNIIAVSHDDLDGVAGPIVQEALLNLTEGNRGFELEKHFITNGKIVDETIANITNRVVSGENISCIYVLDLSPSYDVMKSLYEACKANDVIVSHSDHHISAIKLNELEQQSVVVNHSDGMKASATSLVFQKMVGRTPLEYLSISSEGDIFDKKLKHIASFCEIVRSYDTWDWAKDPENLFGEKAKEVNNLLYLIGRERFIESIVAKEFDFSEFSEVEKLLMEIENEKEKAYVNDKIEGAKLFNVEIEGQERLVAFCLVENYHSVVGNALATLKDEFGRGVDFVIMYNGDKVSIRTNKAHIQANEIANTFFNGNGHKAAAGGNSETMKLLTERLINVLEG